MKTSYDHPLWCIHPKRAVPPMKALPLKWLQYSLPPFLIVGGARRFTTNTCCLCAAQSKFRSILFAAQTVYVLEPGKNFMFVLNAPFNSIISDHQPTTQLYTPDSPDPQYQTVPLDFERPEGSIL